VCVRCRKCTYDPDVILTCGPGESSRSSVPVQPAAQSSSYTALRVLPQTIYEHEASPSEGDMHSTSFSTESRDPQPGLKFKQRHGPKCRTQRNALQCAYALTWLHMECIVKSKKDRSPVHGHLFPIRCKQGYSALTKRVSCRVPGIRTFQPVKEHHNVVSRKHQSPEYEFLQCDAE